MQKELEEKSEDFQWLLEDLKNTVADLEALDIEDKVQLLTVTKKIEEQFKEIFESLDFLIEENSDNNKVKLEITTSREKITRHYTKLIELIRTAQLGTHGSC